MKSRKTVISLLAVVALTALASSPGFADDKVLRVAMNADPDVLDMTQSTNPPQGLATMINVYETLLRSDEKGGSVPLLAESWDILDGGKTIVMHLRHGVKFHSGDAFNAADVVWSHERMSKKTWFYALSSAKFITKVEAVDPYTVKFSFKQPDAMFLQVPALIVASKSYFDRVGEKEFAKHPVGTGPYKIADYRAAQYLDLVAFDDYWGDKPQIKRAHFAFVQDDNTRVTKLQADEVDMIMATPYSAYDQLKGQGFTLVKLPVHPTQSIQMQLANPTSPWHDLRIRKAMAHAIDRQALVKGLLHGLPTAYPRLAPDEIGYDPDLIDYKYDPAKARALAAEAGYPNGWTMPLYYSTGVYFGTLETTEAVALYLKKNLNVDTKVRGIQLIQLLQMLGRIARDPKGEYVGVAGLPIANLTTPLLGVSLAYSGMFAMHKNEKLDALLAKADSILDSTQHAPLIKEMMKIEQEDLSTITLWQYVDIYAMKKNIEYTPMRHSLEVVYLPRVVDKSMM
jgi:peptide/nickel transport system substrate-binding protein